MAHYEYMHRAGYGPDDHRAAEVIARAARALGLSGAAHAVAQQSGFAPHPVGIGYCVRMPACPGVRRTMEAALRRARRELGRVDCRIDVVCVEIETDAERGERIEFHRHGREWREFSREPLKAELKALVGDQ